MSILRKSYIILLITILLFSGISYSKYLVTRSTITTVSSLSDDQIFTVEITDITFDAEILSIKTRMTNALNSVPLSVHLEIDGIDDSTRLLYFQDIDLTGTMEIDHTISITNADLGKVLKFVIRTSGLNGYATGYNEVDNPFYNQFPLALPMAMPTSEETSNENVPEDVPGDIPVAVPEG